MQMRSQPELDDTFQPQVPFQFQKQWGWFYLLITSFIIGLLFLWYKIGIDFFLSAHTTSTAFYQSSALGFGVTMIVVALCARLIEVFSVEINIQTISKKSWGKKTVIRWNEIERVDYDGGITLVGANELLNINPAIFKNPIAVCEFVELQWNQDATNVVHH